MNIIDKLLETPCYIMDFLPKQVPMNCGGQFFEVETYLLNHYDCCGLRDRFVGVILKAMCYYPVSVHWGKWIEQPTPEQVTKIIPFKLSSIENVEMFRFTNPADAEKKVITKSEDIEEIYQTFESVSLKDKTTEPTAGGSVTSFRFNLSDGTSYEVIYSEVAVKSGRVITTGMEQDFFTSAGIGAFWGSYDYEVTTASEDELPALYE